MQAVTCHWISNDWQLKSAVLGCTLMDVSHTGENIQSFVMKIIGDWNLEDKVTTTTTDNAANVLKACRLLQEDDVIEDSVHCFCHTLQLCVKHALEIEGVAPYLKRFSAVVSYFHRSNLAANELVRLQRANQIEHPLGLILDEPDPDPDDVEYATVLLRATT